MGTKMRIMSEKPLNAETPVERLRSWVTANDVFFDRNQGEIPSSTHFAVENWRLSVEGTLQHPLNLKYAQILKMPKAIVANTLECSGNSRSLLQKKARGNPWTVGGVGNAVWGGVWLKQVLNQAGLTADARHVAFEGFDRPLGSAQIKFVRSIPIEKATTSTLLAYEMNGDRLPMRHGYPLRALALGWTGANCVKWLSRITVLEKPFAGFFMDQVYRHYQKGQEPASGEVVTRLALKTIITQPLPEEILSPGSIVVMGAAYGGEPNPAKVEVSVDGGASWHPAELIGPNERYAWRLWQYIWEVQQTGEYTLMARTRDAAGNRQPETARWNVLGYGNNGIREHAVTVTVA